jgi:hypothetical protein
LEACQPTAAIVLHLYQLASYGFRSTPATMTTNIGRDFRKSIPDDCRGHLHGPQDIDLTVMTTCMGHGEAAENGKNQFTAMWPWGTSDGILTAA